jgi:hypothetical protein
MSEITSIATTVKPEQCWPAKRLSHWNIRVFYDEIMTPIGRDEGKKMTGLSLALLEDSGFYSSVDYSYS